MKVPFLNLSEEYLSIKNEIDSSITQVIKKGIYVSGEQVKLFEEEWAKFNGAKHAVSVGNGTDALFLSLKALGIGRGDEIIIPTLTFVSTALSVTHTGATPVFADSLPGYYSIDPKEIEKKISKKTKAIIPVHLYGNPASIEEILKIAKKYKLFVIEDAAQAHGAEYKDKKIGTFGDVGCFSFYPTKNLGAYGDGGAIITNSSDLAKKLTMLRNYGQVEKYNSIKDGYNSRLDEIQAAVLRVKLKHLSAWNTARRKIADVYGAKLSPDIPKLQIFPNSLPIFHLYPILVNKRDALGDMLGSKGITTLIHYPIPIHLQKVYKSQSAKKNLFPVSENVAKHELSLPMHPFLTHQEVAFIAETINNFLSKQLP